MTRDEFAVRPRGGRPTREMQNAECRMHNGGAPAARAGREKGSGPDGAGPSRAGWRGRAALCRGRAGGKRKGGGAAGKPHLPGGGDWEVRLPSRAGRKWRGRRPHRKLVTCHSSLVTARSANAPYRDADGQKKKAARRPPRARMMRDYLRSFRRRTIASAPRPSRLIVAGSGTLTTTIAGSTG